MTKKPDKPDHISQKDWASVDVPELTDDRLSGARPFKEAFPTQFESWKNRGGRPRSEAPKAHIGFRLASDVVSGIKATGKGYNARVEKVLREALETGEALMGVPNSGLWRARHRARRAIGG